jgi:integrase
MASTSFSVSAAVRSHSVTRPRGEYPKIVPWSAERVHAVRAEMGERYRLTVDLGAGCGLRQGEVFGLSVDQVNFADRAVQVIRQVKIVRSRLVFGPPKHGKTREVPLPDSIARAIRAHALAEYLGHADPGFTLRTYTHLMPASSERTRRAVDGVFDLVDPEHAQGPEPALEDEDSGPSTA